MNPANPENLENPENPENHLESLLAVDPSPEFVARVRLRLANEPATSAWRRRWVPALAGALAASVALVLTRPGITVPTGGEAQLTGTGKPSYAADSQSARAEPQSPSDVPSPQDSTTSGRKPRAAASRTFVPNGSPFPAVVFSAAETQGLRALLSLASKGDSELGAMLEIASQVTPAHDIRISALAIDPLEIPSIEPDTY